MKTLTRRMLSIFRRKSISVAVYRQHQQFSLLYYDFFFFSLVELVNSWCSWCRSPEAENQFENAIRRHKSDFPASVKSLLVTAVNHVHPVKAMITAHVNGNHTASNQRPLTDKPCVWWWCWGGLVVRI